MENTLVKDVMSDNPHIISSTDTLRAAAKNMLEYKCGALPVCENGRLKGIITDRDIVIYGLAENKDPDSEIIANIMEKNVQSCLGDETLQHAADIMSEYDIRRLIVLNEDDKIIGVISTADMLKCVNSDDINDDIVHHLFRYA